MSTPHAPSMRPTAVAGLFYPAERETLSRTVSQLLDTAAARARKVPKAIVAPHAGFVYSGPIAANAYAQLSPARAAIKRVVLLGPTHRVAVRGLAIPSVTHFDSPLGVVELDSAVLAQLRHLPHIVVSDAAHALEHSLEVHLPFLQKVVDDFKLVPLAVGDATADEVATALDCVWGGAETLIVVSSDLSHYLDYREAQTVDRATCDAILALRTDIDHDQACGARPLCGLTAVARRRRLEAELLDLRSSGDTAGDKHRVVGYGAFAFYEP